MFVFSTFDVELSPGRYRRHPTELAANIAGAYYGGATGRWGLLDQLQAMSAAGLKAVCFVEALSSLVVGAAHLQRICEEIQELGHEIQLHTHPEWLMMSDRPALHALGAEGMRELGLAAQTAVIELGLEALHRAGVPHVLAHRAGSFHANADTLRAAAAQGLRFDSSYNASFLGDGCDIDLGGIQFAPRHVGAIWSVPVSNLRTRGGRLRHLQLCAISVSELRQGLAALRAAGTTHATLLSHSFELLCRGRSKPSRLLVRRFLDTTALLAEDQHCTVSGFADVVEAEIDETAWDRAPAPVAFGATLLRTASQPLAGWAESESRPRPSGVTGRDISLRARRMAG
jgi:hypothetical protein